MAVKKGHNKQCPWTTVNQELRIPKWDLCFWCNPKGRLNGR